MPHIKVKTSSGTVNFHYTISTPSSESAKSIDKNLPTIIFLHPVFIAQDIFQPQFGDAQIRRFNLVAIDARAHGETSGKVGKNYSRVAAAEDIYKVMESLKLPACHLVGVSMGACTSLQLAMSFPQKVISLTMISPLPLEEPPEVAEGRQEIYDCWAAAFTSRSQVDEVALQDAAAGALQLGFNSMESSFINALIARTLPQGLKNWGPNNLEDFHTVSVKFFANRKRHPNSSLAKIRCPIKLIHGTGDIAYPVSYTEEFLQALQDAQVDAQLVIIQDACHFGNVTHAKEINHVLYHFVLDNTNNTVPPPPTSVTSPFEAGLIKAGWDRDESDSDVDSRSMTLDM